MLLLLPSDPIRRRRVDKQFADEARVAADLGFDVALVDHDALSRGAPAADAVRMVPAGGTAVYRGWMLRGEQYEGLSAALTSRGVTLRTSPDHYRRAHELPGWAQATQPLAAPTRWTSGADLDRFDDACRSLGPGPAVLRDYVKSMKHYWAEATFIPDVSDRPAAHAVAARFLELREDEFVGGLVLRRFETYVGLEVRTWWVDGRCVHVGPHPDEPSAASEDAVYPADADLIGVAEAVAALGLTFVTVDLARRDDGVWRVIEIGDGQVSDRGPVDPATLLTALRGSGRSEDST